MFSAASADLEPMDNRHQLVAVLAMTDDHAPPPALTRSSTMRQLSVRILQHQWQALISQESGVREADDVDAVHDMRVATRRLRAALRLYEEVYPPRGQEVRQQLAELADALGRGAATWTCSSPSCAPGRRRRASPTGARLTA